MINKIKILLIVVLCSLTIFSKDKSFENKLNSIIQKIPKSSRFAILVIDPMTDDTIYSYNPELSLIPASNTKLFTTAAALFIIGINHKFSTKIYSEDDNFSDGVINGNIYIKGFGNSLFNDNDLENLANQIARYGIKRITGNIIGDDSFFDKNYFRSDWIEDEAENNKLPPVSAVVLNRNQKVSYKKVRKRMRKYVELIKQPDIYIAEQLKNLLASKDIIIEGNSIAGTTPRSAKEIASVSTDMMKILQLVNKNSDNFLAEVLFKSIGAIASGEEGTAFNSAQAIHTFLDDNDVVLSGSRIVDGSGLSRSNKISVASIVSLLEMIYLNLEKYEIFLQTLSVAGHDGTLGGRMGRTSAEFNFRGKTGTLNGASSLSGYLKTNSGDDLIVSMIFEYSKGGINFYRKIQDEIIEALAEYSTYPAN